MENQEKTFHTICRVCLGHGKAENMVSLTDNSDENGLSPYGITYEKLTKLSVLQNNFLPLKICQNCKKSLEKVATFMINSEASEKKLAKVVNFSLKHELSEDMVKEVIHQFSLFNQNFPEGTSLISDTAGTSNQYKSKKLLPDKHPAKTEEKRTKIKVEVEDQLGLYSDSDDSTEIICQSPQTDSKNVDIFLYSIQKLITTKIEDLEQRIRDVKPKTNLKPKAENDFSCHICQRVLANQFTYKHHMERKHGTCRFVCDQCGKGFPVMAELTQHQIYRHGLGSTLECDQCSFKAARRLELIEHIRLHTGERPFTCEICGLTFRRKAIYKNHLKSHGERTVQCDYCPRKFYRRSEMLSHSNNIHDRVYAFVCKVCNVTYAMAKTVRRHMLVKHGIPRNKQGKVVRINKDVGSDSNFFKEAKEQRSEFTQL